MLVLDEFGGLFEHNIIEITNGLESKGGWWMG